MQAFGSSGVGTKYPKGVNATIMKEIWTQRVALEAKFRQKQQQKREEQEESDDDVNEMDQDDEKEKEVEMHARAWEAIEMAIHNCIAHSKYSWLLPGQTRL